MATAQNIASHFERLESLVKAELDQLESVEDVGPVVAENLYRFFRDSKNLSIIDQLISSGISLTPRQALINDLPLIGTTWVITGKLESLSRGDAEAQLRALGASTTQSVTKKTNYLVAGAGFGAKRSKAEALGIPILDEDSLLKSLRVR